MANEIPHQPSEFFVLNMLKGHWKKSVFAFIFEQKLLLMLPL